MYIYIHIYYMYIILYIYAYIYIHIYYMYGTYHWRSFRSTYKKLAWVRFEHTTTEFRSDALTNWALKPWVQLALRATDEAPVKKRNFCWVNIHYFIFSLAIIFDMAFSDTYINITIWMALLQMYLAKLKLINTATQQQ